MGFKWIKWVFFCSMGVGVGFLHPNFATSIFKRRKK